VRHPEPSLAERVALQRRPAGWPAGYQEWRRLRFVHWPLPVDVLRPLVPPALQIDQYAGVAYVGLVPFWVQAARPLGAPRHLGLRFLEANVRTYVHRGGREPGVYFLSLDAASRLAVIGARTSLGLPYRYASGQEHVSAEGIDYWLERRAARRPAVHVRYQPGSSLGVAQPGTLDFFLIERYLLHVQRGPSLWSVRVNHQPYPLQRVTLHSLEDRLLEADGVPRPGGAPLVHFSPGVNVEVFPPAVRLMSRGRAARRVRPGGCG
jgi:uncharacterized protein YqjF (DUF2071 family)